MEDLKQKLITAINSYIEQAKSKKKIKYNPFYFLEICKKAL